LVTIREVAEKAGVSIGTVSRVLNNKSGVSEVKRKHVISITQELGYIPHKRVPLSVTQVTHLGLLIRPTEQPLTSDPFYGGIFHGVETTCQEYHISTSFSTLDIINGRLRRLPAMISDERISGLVLLGALPYKVVKSLDESVQLPLVLIDNLYNNCEWDSIMIENVRGAYSGVKHLIVNGHRDIVMMIGPNHPSILERREGYEMAMLEHNLKPVYIKTNSPSPEDGLSPSDGESGILEILRKAPQATGVFCSNDNQAIGALIKLQHLGFKVPDDLSIVGFDDIITGKFTSPPITTVHVDRTSLGRIATQSLINRINNPEQAIIKTIVGTRLVGRESVGPPRTYKIEFNGGEA
jgi:LacI family transcriptional regulator